MRQSVTQDLSPAAGYAMINENGKGRRCEEKVQRIAEEYRRLSPVGTGIIALDGRSAAGKTTLAGLLTAALNGAVVHTDDFFLPPELRTAQRLAAPGGNVHIERFAEEVLPYLRQGKPFCYRRFDCHAMDYADEMVVPAAPVIIVEGAYSCHPLLGHYADLTVFCDIDPQEQESRIRSRNGEAGWQIFRERWIPLEESYLREYRIKENADLVV